MNTLAHTKCWRVDSVANRLDLLEGTMIHHVFHIAQLKLFATDYTPVYGSLLVTTDLEVAATTPHAIFDRRLVRKGSTTIPKPRCYAWIGLPESSATWEDYYVLNQRFRLKLGDKLHLRWGRCHG